MELVLGADVEFFLQDREQGHPVSAIGKLNATKTRKKRLLSPAEKEAEDGGAVNTNPAFVHVDNVALEINTPVFRGPTAPTELASFLQNFFLRWRQYKLFDGYTKVQPTWNSVAQFSRDDLAPKAARQFGCEPFFSAYDPAGTAIFINSNQMRQFRTVGFHLHFDFDENVLPAPAFIQLLDLALYYPLIARLQVPGTTGAGLRDHLKSSFGEEYSASGGYFTASKYGIGYRLKGYGQPGAYRRTSYGLEYRALPTCKQALASLPVITILFDLIANTPELLQDEYFRVPWQNLYEMARRGEAFYLQDELAQLQRKLIAIPLLAAAVPTERSRVQLTGRGTSRLFNEYLNGTTITS